MSEKRQIIGMTRTELVELFKGLGEPAYRADQVFRSLYERRLRSFDEMTDLPKALRTKLDSALVIACLSIDQKFTSIDGTRRFLMKAADGRPVETVFIPTDSRDTICFSSQSGCPLKCDFCLTAKLGLLRNLSVGEIVDQIIIVLNDVYGIGNETPHGTNLVGMGAGEPFLNFENLIASLRLMSDKKGLHIVPNRVTISTAGIVPRIIEFSELQDRPHLAISLTAANDELRDRLMPINKKWDLSELMSAANRFQSSLRRGERFTFEYVMLGGVNDSSEDAERLAEMLRNNGLSRIKINLIPHNGAEQLDYSASTPEAVAHFKSRLESLGVSAYVRQPRGRDIYAACGQLAVKDQSDVAKAASQLIDA